MCLTPWGSGHGHINYRVQLNGTEGLTPSNANAFASICEWSRDRDAGFIGDAHMATSNVVVGVGYVDVWVQIDWPHDLEYKLSVLICPR